MMDDNIGDDEPEDDNNGKSSPRGDAGKNKAASSRTSSPVRQVKQLQQNSDGEADTEEPIEQAPKSANKKSSNSTTAKSTKVPLFAVGDQVEAKREGQQKYRFAVIAKVYDDNTFDVVYSDRFRERLSGELIQFPFGNEEETTTQPEEKRPSTGNGGAKNNNLNGGKTDKKINPTSSTSSCPFKVGMTVEARYQGGRVYYPGKITKVNAEDETVSVLYDDGDEEDLVPFSFILPPDATSSPTRSTTTANNKSKTQPQSMLNKKIKFPIGSKVEGNYRNTGKWYPGVIADIREEDGEYIYSIDYNDGDKDDQMSVERLREPKPRRPTGRPVLSKEMQDEVDDAIGGDDEGEKMKSSPLKNRNKTVPSGDKKGVKKSEDEELNASPPNKEKKEKKAESVANALGIHSIRIEGNYANQGVWYPGRILKERPNGRVDIEYDDGDREENVPLDRIRRLLPSMERDTGAESDHAAKEEPQESYMEGDRVEANFRNAGQYYPGRITKVKTDATTGLRYVDVLFDDGDSEKGVPLHRVRKLNDNKKSKEKKSHSKHHHRSHHHDETTDGDEEETDRDKQRKAQKGGKSRLTGGGKANETGGESEAVVDPVDGGALIEMRDSDKKWYLGRIVNVNQKKGHATIRLLHSGETRSKVQFNLIRMPKSGTVAKEPNTTTNDGNGFVELNARDIQALRALLQEKDEEISRLRKMVKQLELHPNNTSTIPGVGGIDSTTLNNEINALKKSNEDLKTSVIFLGEKFSLVVDELVNVKNKNNQLSKQVKAQGDEINRWKSMGVGNVVMTTPKGGRTSK